MMRQEQELEHSHHKHSRHKHSHHDSHMEQETAISLPDGVNHSEFNLKLNVFSNQLTRPMSEAEKSDLEHTLAATGSKSLLKKSDSKEKQ